jgi:hypothetical protein
MNISSFVHQPKEEEVLGRTKGEDKRSCEGGSDEVEADTERTVGEVHSCGGMKEVLPCCLGQVEASASWDNSRLEAVEDIDVLRFRCRILEEVPTAVVLS